MDINGEGTGGGDCPTVKQDNTAVAPVNRNAGSSRSTDVYNVNSFDQQELGSYERGERGITCWSRRCSIQNGRAFR